MNEEGVPPDDSTAGVLVRLRGLLPSLSVKERAIGDVVLKDPAGVAQLSISQVAQRAGVSDTSVTRFCHAAGAHRLPRAAAGACCGGAARALRVAAACRNAGQYRARRHSRRGCGEDGARGQQAPFRTVWSSSIPQRWTRRVGCLPEPGGSRCMASGRAHSWRRTWSTSCSIWACSARRFAMCTVP